MVSHDPPPSIDMVVLAIVNIVLAYCIILVNAQSSVFKGTLSLTLASSGGSCSKVRTFQKSAQLTIGPPVHTSSGLKDKNGNLLIVQTDDDATGGAFSMYTALATTDGALFQYWVYQILERKDRSQYDLSGSMVESSATEAAVLNAFVVEDPIVPSQCTGATTPSYVPVSIGATFEAGLNAKAAKFIIKGTSRNLLYSFQANFEGTFAGGAPIKLS